MVMKRVLHGPVALLVILSLLVSLKPNIGADAQEPVTTPVMVDPALDVRTVLSGLNFPSGLAFIDENEMFIIEKGTGVVQHVVDGAISHAALDLAVNNSSERGLVGITLDPDFANNGYVYLYWTCAAPPAAGDGFFPSLVQCPETPMMGEDTSDILAVPLLGNRLDRFVWDGTSLTWDLNLAIMRAFDADGAPVPRGQGDEAQPPLGSHVGGVITFGHDGKLYLFVGDSGRRSALQNLPFGPPPVAGPGEMPADVSDDSEPAADAAADAGLNAEADSFSAPDGPTAFPGLGGRERGLPSPVADDQFGGPMPDDAHFSGVILRLNPDGSIPADNPFYEVGALVGGEIGENLQMIFSYGHRNSFGMDIDPISGQVWLQENGEDAFDEINRVTPGQNSGWVQIQGPLYRLREYREIETTSLHNEDFPNLAQLRWPPENIATSRTEALKRLFWLPGSAFSNPEFSWKYVIPPAAIGFAKGQGLGEEYYGDLFVGLAVPGPLGGALFRFDLTADRRRFEFSDPRLKDRVADNLAPYDFTEAESLVAGTGFGILTDLETGPNGNLYALSLSNGALYEIFRREAGTEATAFNAQLSGAAEVPGPGDEDGTGIARILVDPPAARVCSAIGVANISLPAAAAHIHVGGPDVAGPVVVPLAAPDASGSAAGCVEGVDPALIEAILADPGGYYVNVHNADFPDGAVRGQLSAEPGG